MLGDLVLGRPGRPTATGSSIMTSPIGVVRRRDDQVAQRQDADEPAVGVDDVDVVDGLGVGLELAQPVDRLAAAVRSAGTATNSVVIIPPAVSSG